MPDADARMWTHAELVAVAARWLQGSRRCAVVITEMTTGERETPDAIGWQGRNSFVVECKASVADWRADAKKYFRRQPERGMGRQRYWLVPKLLAEHAPADDGWGLVVVNDAGRARLARESRWWREWNAAAEVGLLVSALRRVGQTAPAGVSVRCYTYQTGNRATLGVAEESPDA